MPSSLKSFNWRRRGSQDSLRPRSTASTAPSLPPYTVEPFLLSPLADCPGSPDTLVPSYLSATTLQESKERPQPHGYYPTSQAAHPDSVADHDRPVGAADETERRSSSSGLPLTPSTLDLNSHERQNEEPDQPTLISEALQAGESIYALHHRTAYDPKGNKNDNATHIRLQSVYLGELVYKVKHYFSLVRRSRCIAERVQRNLIDRALQLCSQLKTKEVTIPTFWMNMVTLVNETQRLLSNRHLDLGVGELAASLSEIEQSLTTRKSRANLRPSRAAGSSDPGPSTSRTNVASSVSGRSTGPSSASGRSDNRRPSRDQTNAWSDIEWIYLFG